MQTFKQKTHRKISLKTAIFSIITALLAQYLWLEGSVLAANVKYFPWRGLPALSSAYQLKEYQLVNYRVSLKVPENTELIVTPDRGQEMQFNIYFTNEVLAFRGYFQLWKMKDLESFLKRSKTLSPFDFIFYQLDSFRQNQQDGFKTEWSANFGEHWVSGQEYWLKLDNPEEAVRLSFYTDSKAFPEGLKPICQKILDSLAVAEAP